MKEPKCKHNERESCEECDYEEEKSYWTKTQFEENIPAWFSLADYCTDCVTEYDGIYCCDLPQEMWKDKIMRWKKEMTEMKCEEGFFAGWVHFPDDWKVEFEDRI